MKEFVIGINDPVWLDNPAAPQTSNFDRLYLEDKSRIAQLRLLNGQIRSIDLSQIPVHLNHWLSREATEPDKRVSPLAFKEDTQWAAHTPKSPAINQPLYTDINKFAKVEPEKPAPVTVLAGGQLQLTGVVGLAIKTAGRETVFPSSLIRCLVTNPAEHTFTLFIVNPESGEIEKNTYNTPKIKLTSLTQERS